MTHKAIQEVFEDINSRVLDMTERDFIDLAGILRLLQGTGCEAYVASYVVACTTCRLVEESFRVLIGINHYTVHPMEDSENAGVYMRILKMAGYNICPGYLDLAHRYYEAKNTKYRLRGLITMALTQK